MKCKGSAVVLVIAGTLAVPSAAGAAGSDELWEVSSQMNMPGMPAGMGASTQQVCQDKDPAKQTVQGQNMENCKITDLKQSGTRMTMTVTCPDSKALIEQTYNAARTEFKGSMRMTTRDGEMTMNMSGRKIGSCDAKQARREREAQVAKIQGQADEGRRQSKEVADRQIKQCTEAVDTMDMSKLGAYSQCRQQPELCKAMASDPIMKPAVTACNARAAEFCRRYQTEDGFLKAKGNQRAAEMCGVSAEQVKAKLCPGAAQKESLAFLGRYCLAEAKPFADKHCAGRDFTALRSTGGKGDKYSEFCYAYMSNASIESAATPRAAPASEASVIPNPTEAIGEGINQGLNKLKGLFGR